MLDAREQIERFQEFIEAEYKKEIYQIKTKGIKALVIDFRDLAKYDHELSDALLEDPEEVAKAAEISLEKFDIQSKDIRVRFKELPKTQEIKIRNIRSEHINKFFYFDGIVRQSSDVRPQVTSAKFECPSCGNAITILQIDTQFKEPSRCSCGRRGRFRLLSKDLVDVQRLIVEESPETLEGGGQPKRLSVFLKEDLVEPKMEKKTTPGSKIRVYGVIKEVAISLKSGVKSTRFDLMSDANFIMPIEETFEELDINEEDINKIKEIANDKDVYQKLINSIAPSIYGNEKIKEAMLLQLMGGVKKETKEGTKTRGDMHILLIGDPGSGKSKSLEFVSKIAPKGRLVSGKGISGVGLCVAPDSFTLLNPGEIYPIKKVVEDELSNNTIEYTKDISVAKNPVKSKKIYSLTDDLKVKSAYIDQFWRIKPPKYMVKIKTQSGKEIIVTKKTKLMAIKDGEISWNESEYLKKGNYVATARFIPSSNENKIISLSLIKSNPIVYGVKNCVKEMIHKITKQKKVNKRQLATELKLNENKLYYHWINNNARGNIHLNDLKRLADLSSTSIEDIAKRVSGISLRNGYRITLPLYLNEDLMYFAGLMVGDGDLSGNEDRVSIRLSNSNKFIQRLFKTLSKKLFSVNVNISSKKSKKRSESWRFSSKIVFEILDSLGIPLSPKSHKIDMKNNLLNLPNNMVGCFLRGYFDSDGGPVNRDDGYGAIELNTTSKNMAKKLQLVLLRFGIHSKLRNRKNKITITKDRRLINPKKQKFEIRISGLNNLILFKNSIGFSHPEKEKKLYRIINYVKKSHSNIDVIPDIGLFLRKIKNKYGLTSKEMFGYKTTNYFLNSKNFSRNRLNNVLKNLVNMRVIEKDINTIANLANSDIFWEKIVSKDIIKHNYDYVYDLTVKDSHNFLVNGFIVHNTASIVRDEFLRGWALEAGALVLSNGGFVFIDELDKIDPEDTAAMHQALEQQIITISKANVQATLKAETTVLGAANPKYGRFDPYQSVASQINLPSTLINRFDLIFPIRDIPSRERDDKIASHLLKLHQKPEDLKSDIPIDLLRKYIAYVRQNIHPKLTNEAINEIKKFYVELRNKPSSGSEEDVKPIPISARQLEALVRLSEASAKVRLSEKVTKEDSKRAIDLMKHCLMQVGFDYETGQIDIDRISSGIPASQRSRIFAVREIIRDLEEKVGKSVPMEEIISAAEEKGITIDQVEEVIERLKREGSLYEPKKGLISSI